MLLVFLLWLFQPAYLCSDTLVTNNYSAFETLMLTDRNLDQLASAFFPDNLHRAVTVNVSYQFVWPEGEWTADDWSNETVLHFSMVFFSSTFVHQSVFTQWSFVECI